MILIEVARLFIHEILVDQALGGYDCVGTTSENVQ